MVAKITATKSKFPRKTITYGLIILAVILAVILYSAWWIASSVSASNNITFNSVLYQQNLCLYNQICGAGLHVYYSSSHVNITKNETLVVTLNTNAESNFSLLTPTEYKNYINGSNSATVYTKFGILDGFLIIPNITGSYYAVFQTVSNSSGSGAYTVSKMASTKIIQPPYEENLIIRNASFVNITAISKVPIKIFISNSVGGYNSVFNMTERNVSMQVLLSRLISMNKGNYTILVNSTKNGSVLLSVNIKPNTTKVT